PRDRASPARDHEGRRLNLAGGKAMVALVLIIAGQSADAALVNYHAVTAVGPHCEAAANPSDITVCARRTADRYRLPLIETDPGNPKTQDVMGERERLFARTSNCQEKSVFLVG